MFMLGFVGSSISEVEFHYELNSSLLKGIKKVQYFWAIHLYFNLLFMGFQG